MCPSPIIANLTTLTVRTDMWYCFLKITIVAIHGLGIHVQGQWNITIRTIIHIATVTTHDKRGIPTTVQHQYDLFLTCQTFPDFFQKRWCKITRLLTAHKILEVHHFHLRNFSIRISPLCQLKKMVNPFLSSRPCLNRGCCWPKDEHSSMTLSSKQGNISCMIARIGLLFISSLMFLIDNDCPDIVQRSKDSRTRSYHNFCLTRFNLTPLVKFLTVWQAWMHNRHQVPKTWNETISHLGCQGNLWYQDNSRFPHSQGPLDKMQIDLCLTWSRYPFQ